MNQSEPLTQTDRQRLFEIAAVVVTGFGKFLLVDYLHLKFWYIISASILWLSYILICIRKNKSIPVYWGFKKEGFTSSLKLVVPVALCFVAVFLISGALLKVSVLNWHIVPVLILYPLWGTIQQFLIIGLLVRNLTDYQTLRIPRSSVIIIASIVFSAVHYPSLPLMISTFFLALFYCYVYLKYRNLWVLGIFHGWMGGLFYFLVLGRDPWLEFIQAIR